MMGTLAMEAPARYATPAPADAVITEKIHFIRGQKVMLDRDLSELYGVQVKVLKQAVRRNMERFPEDFLFELDLEEAEASRSRIVTLKRGENIKYLPFAFTDCAFAKPSAKQGRGILMLANVLRSEQAIAVSIHIIRVFTRTREAVMAHREVLWKLEQLEGRLTGHDEEIQAIFDHLTALVSPTQQTRNPIGFKPGEA
jgi:hypothetical protein